MNMKTIWYLFPLLILLLYTGFSLADIQPVSDVQVSILESFPEQIQIRSISVQDYTIPAERLITGTSMGLATAVGAPYNQLNNADNLDLNLFAGRNKENPAFWIVTGLGGEALYHDRNGQRPDFFLFETGGNDDFEVQAILPDGSLGIAVQIPKSTWGDTGLRISAPVHQGQKIVGLSWALTDMLDAEGKPLAADQAITGLQIISPNLDPACFCATVDTVVNQAPTADAGEDIFLFAPETVTTLAGQATDDGLGDPDGTLYYHWSPLEGPGEVLFEPNAFVPSPIVTLQGGPGVYVLEWNVSDGELEASDQIALYLLQETQGSPTLLINELLADSDPSSPEQEDWIELFNPGEQPVNVAGYYLTDNLDNPTRWRIPGAANGTTTLPAHGFLRVWADADPLAGGLHASFKLSTDGEAVALIGPDGESLVDIVIFDKQRPGVARGREPDGSDRWVTLNPSPGRSNNGQHLPLVADIEFDRDRGFYEKPFRLTLSNTTPGTTLVYTTDGSEPTTKHGRQGASPVTIDITTTTVVRAMAFKNGMRATRVTSLSYLFLNDVIRQPLEVPGYPRPWTWLGGSDYDHHDYEMDPAVVDHPAYRDEIIPSLLAIPTMSIAVEPDELADENGFYWGSGETPCSMELIFPDDPSENVQVNAGVVKHSHDRMKRSLRLNFRAEYGDAKLRTSLIQQGSLHGDTATDTFDRLILRGGNNRSWARKWNPDKTAYTIDQWYRDRQTELSGHGSRGAFVHLYINGLYWGLYNPVERTDEWYTSAYFGGEPEDWFAVHHGSSSNGFNGSSSRWRTLLDDLIKRDLSTPENYAQVKAYLDVENFCDYLMLTWWMGVSDWPRNNWYAGCRNATSPQGPTPLRFFGWDAEWSWDTNNGTPGTVHSEFRSNRSGGNSPIPQVWNAVRHNPDFMMLFADRVYRHFFNGGALTESAAQASWLRINELVRDAVVAESARWGDTMENHGHPTRTRDVDWQRQVDKIHSMIQGNTTKFIQHLRQQGYYPELDPPVFSQRGGAVENEYTLLLTNPNGAGDVYYTLDGSDPRSGAVPVDAMTTILFGENAPKRVLVPTRNIGSDWRGLRDFDDSQWINGQGGVGYERSSGYDPYIQIDTQAAMYQKQASCYIRIPFHFNGDLDAIDTLTLYVRYDDGFVAYLNGVEIARANITPPPTWSSASTSSHNDSDAKVLERFSLNNATDHLRNGHNILAIHGLNTENNSSDFLISTKLEVSSIETPVNENPDTGGILARDPRTLPHSCIVKTRVRSGTEWSALNEATFSVGSVAENLRISEIMYHPYSEEKTTDPNTEFVELTNIGSESINLHLVQFSDGISFTFPVYQLDPGARVLVVEDIHAFKDRYENDLSVVGQYQGKLSNGGERIELTDTIGQNILNFNYRDGWYEETDGQGKSLELRDPTSDNDLNEETSWQSSIHIGGTPGR